jgi:hypothetical protein
VSRSQLDEVGQVLDRIPFPIPKPISEVVDRNAKESIRISTLDQELGVVFGNDLGAKAIPNKNIFGFKNKK